MRELEAAYRDEDRGFELVRVAGGYRFQSHADLAPYVERFVLEGQTARLSAAALETLAIVAYKQPVSRAQIAAIRGVNVDGVIRTLQARGFIDEVGRDPGPGQAVLYGTTPLLLERLGLDRIEDLPAAGPVRSRAGDHGHPRAQPAGRARPGPGRRRPSTRRRRPRTATRRQRPTSVGRRRRQRPRRAATSDGERPRRAPATGGGDRRAGDSSDGPRPRTGDQPQPAVNGSRRCWPSGASGSRRACEELIAAGRVAGQRRGGRRSAGGSTPTTDRVTVDGVPVSVAARAGLLPAQQAGRRRQHRRRPPGPAGRSPGWSRRSRGSTRSGRLDADSEGLLLLTNDGDLTYRLTHPGFGVEKEYLVAVDGTPRPGSAAPAAGGRRSGGRPHRAGPGGRRSAPSGLRITIHEGRNRQVRRMCDGGRPSRCSAWSAPASARCGWPRLAPGEWRELTPAEVRALEQAAATPADRRPGGAAGLDRHRRVVAARGPPWSGCRRWPDPTDRRPHGCDRR